MDGLKVYKDKQYLIFDFENENKKVKYDLAKQETIGFSGKIVKDLKRQLANISMEDIIESCVDKNYSDFLKTVYQLEYNRNCNIKNIGTILSKIIYYKNYEQLFSAGLSDVINFHVNFKYTINEIPKSLIKVAKENKIKINNDLVKYYKLHINEYYLAFNLDYLSLSKETVKTILTASDFYGRRSYIDILLKDFGYQIKPLMNYFDYLATFEALDFNYESMIREFYDYVNMMSQISKKYDKYPKHFLTTHCIASRTYNRLKKEFPEKLFENRINKNLEWKYKDFVFIYPNTTQDIKDEACMQSNCVASYIDKVINGECHIMFMRNKNSVDKSLVTLEIRNNQIVQAREKYNHDLSPLEEEAVNAYNQKFKILQKSA